MIRYIRTALILCAALFSSHPAIAQFSQQGPISADGNTILVGGPTDADVLDRAAPNGSERIDVGVVITP